MFCMQTLERISPQLNGEVAKKELGANSEGERSAKSITLIPLARLLSQCLPWMLAQEEDVIPVHGATRLPVHPISKSDHCS